MTQLTNSTEDKRSLWLEARKQYIGGSDIGTILGLNAYGCPRAVWYEKVGVLGCQVQEETGAMRRGTILEPIAAKEFNDNYLAPPFALEKLEESPEYYQELADLSPHSWMAGTPDYFVVEEGGRWESILEIKTAAKWVFNKAKKEGGLPSHIAQLKWYLILTQLREGHLFYLWPDGWESFDATVALSAQDEVELKTAGLNFWNSVIDGRQQFSGDIEVTALEPSLESLARLPSNDKRCGRCPHYSTCKPDIPLESPVVGDKPLDMSQDQEWGTAVSSYEAATARLNEAKASQQDARALLEEKMGNNPYAEGAGVKISWAPHSRTSLDAKALTATHPEIASQFQKTTSLRPFKVTKK